MHIVMFGDQHLESLGGAQVSMRLQRRFLEKAGHTVTVVAPAIHTRRTVAVDDAYVDAPSVPITLDREYAFTWPGVRTDAWLDRALARRPGSDVVHVQADFWGGFLGYRFAARHGLPVVHTMHNRVDVGIQAVAPAPTTVLRALNAWQRRAMPGGANGVEGSDGWAYLARMAARAAAVTAPSAHFARRLEAHGVRPGRGSAVSPTETEPAGDDGTGVDVVWNGIDDDILDAALAAAPAERAPGPPRFVWLGRFSPEKRLLPFLEAVAAAGVDAEVEVIGGGAQERAARRLVARRRPVASVSFAGRLPYAETLRRIASADAVVQTSVGFETQGMTVFEAASLGTPAIVCDPDIAGELGSGFWPVGGAGAAPDSVGALAAALRQAAADIRDGVSPAPDPDVREKFRQSSRTAAMVEVYRRATR